MNMKPILFNTNMVRAILDDRKMVTRRAIKGVGPEWASRGIDKHPYEIIVRADGMPYSHELNGPHAVFFDEGVRFKIHMVKVPYCPGDILYVRETWAPFYETMHSVPVIDYRYYSETDEEIKERLPEYLNWYWPGKWSPSIHMPREAARIFLRVTDVRVERLWDMTNNDFVNDFGYSMDAIAVVGRETLGRAVWDSTIKPVDRALYGWDANPWVWVIEFERIHKPD